MTNLPIALAERGIAPDPAIRAGIRMLLRKRASEQAVTGAEARHRAFVEAMTRQPLALHTDKANEQHYELPAAFFEAVLGPRLKYSCALYDSEPASLAEAEEAMLALTCERADLHDGHTVLELGCGWGSLTLWMAERYPRCAVTAVSNSAAQKAFIEDRARAAGLSNVQVVTADMNDFATDRRYDRIVSVEMFEHMRNYPLLFERIAGWLAPEGRLFAHIFCHRAYAYPYETEGAGNWMGRYFFTGGTMPSYDLFTEFDRDLAVEERWRVNGRHYYRTSMDWLRRLDANRAAVMPILETAYGKRDAPLWFNRWRMFFLACAELFAYREGGEWFVGHYRFRRA